MKLTGPMRASRVRWVGAILGLVASACVAVALAAPAHVRDQAAVAVGMKVSGDRLTGLGPSAAFTVFQPDTLLQGVRLITHTYRPGHVQGGQAQPIASSSARRLAGQNLDADLVDTAKQRAESHLRRSAGPKLVLIYASDADAWIELVQGPAAGQALPDGDRLPVRGAQAVGMHRDGRDVVTWIERGTRIEIHTTLGRATTLQVATRLVPSSLEQVESRAERR
jgi:hypothetical protein